MTISQKDIKLLWGKAASRCAFPDCRLQLTQNAESGSSNITIGHQAHIVAKEKNGPRGESPLTASERDSYANLILLCPNHHTIIDQNPEDYPIEKLHLLKRNHELWVEQSLSGAQNLKEQANELIYTYLVDVASELCHLHEWTNWASDIKGSDPPILRATIGDDFQTFYEIVLQADFPGTLIELEKSLQTLAISVNGCVHTIKRCGNIEPIKEFDILHSPDSYDRNNYIFKVTKCHKPGFYLSPPEFHKALELYRIRCDICDTWVVNATKAANWFREIVRRDINPMFFATNGKFTTKYELSYIHYENAKDHIPEFTAEEKRTLPQSIKPIEIP